jgi:hypothetical protein
LSNTARDTITKPNSRPRKTICGVLNVKLRACANLLETRIIFIRSLIFVKISLCRDTRRLPAYSLPELQALNRELKQLAVLQSALAEILPDDLSTSTRVSVMKAGSVTLSANNGAIAAKLKQLTPRF